MDVPNYGLSLNNANFHPIRRGFPPGEQKFHKRLDKQAFFLLSAGHHTLWNDDPFIQRGFHEKFRSLLALTLLSMSLFAMRVTCITADCGGSNGTCWTLYQCWAEDGTQMQLLTLYGC